MAALESAVPPEVVPPDATPASAGSDENPVADAPASPPPGSPPPTEADAPPRDAPGTPPESDARAAEPNDAPSAAEEANGEAKAAAAPRPPSPPRPAPPPNPPASASPRSPRSASDEDAIELAALEAKAADLEARLEAARAAEPPDEALVASLEDILREARYDARARRDARDAARRVREDAIELAALESRAAAVNTRLEAARAADPSNETLLASLAKDLWEARYEARRRRDAHAELSAVPRALEPKVMAPRETPPGATPRRVQTERKRREYRAGDIDALLRAFGPDVDALVAEARSTPLDAFDDRELETRDPARVWLDPRALRAKGEKDAPGGVRAKTAVYSGRAGHPLWTGCRVVGGDAEADRYDLRLDRDDSLRVGVPRLDVCFATEDPAAFASRRVAAYAARRRGEAEMLAKLCADSMPLDGMPGADADAHKRVRSKVGPRADAPAHAESMGMLTREYDEVRRRAMCAFAYREASDAAARRAAEGDDTPRGGFDLEAAAEAMFAKRADPRDLIEGPASELSALLIAAPNKTTEGLGTPGTTGPSRYERRFERVASRPSVEDFPASYEVTYAKTVRGESVFLSSASGAAEYDFDARFSAFSHRTTLTKPEALACATRVRELCLDLLERGRAFAPPRDPSTPPPTLEQFDESHRAAALALRERVRDRWWRATRDAVVDAFRDAGKGWYNLNEADKTSYDFSKMKTFLTATRLKMEDALRSLYLRDVDAFSTRTRDALATPLEVVASNDVRLGAAARSAPPILFALEMRVRPAEAAEDGAAPGFEYATPPASFAATIAALFENALDASRDVPTLEPEIMTALRWTWRPTLAVPSARGGAIDDDPKKAKRDHASLRELRDACETVGGHLDAFLRAHDRKDEKAKAKAMREEALLPEYRAKLDDAEAKEANALAPEKPEKPKARALVAVGAVSVDARDLRAYLLALAEAKKDLAEAETRGGSNDAFAEVALRELRDACETAAGHLDAYLRAYDRFAPYLVIDADAEAKALREPFDSGKEDEDGRLQAYREKLDETEKKLAEARRLVPSAPVAVGAVSVDARAVRDAIVSKLESVSDKTRQLIAEFPRKICQRVCKEYEELCATLEVPTEDPETVQALRDAVDAVPKFSRDRAMALEEAAPYYAAIGAMHRTITDDDAKLRANAEFWPIRIKKTIRKALEDAAVDQKRYEEEQAAAQERFADEIEELEASVSTLAELTDMSETELYADRVGAIDERIRAAQATAALFNSREAVFGKRPTNYNKIRVVAEVLEPFHKFWTYAANWKRWKVGWLVETPFASLDAEEMEQKVSDASKSMHKMQKQFTTKKLPTCASNCETIKKELDAFAKFVPLTLALRSAGMRPRHWERLAEAPSEGGVGVSIPWDDAEFTLEKLIAMDVFDGGAMEEDIVKICDVAGKEYGIETALTKMYEEWAGVELEVKEYRDTKTYVIRVEEVISQMLDDHIVMAQAMLFSPFKKPFEEDIARWEKTLSVVSEVLDEWTKLQRQWMYLQPIFGSKDIMEQLPLEGNRFKVVNDRWKKTLARAEQSPGVLKLCDDRTLLEQFKESNRVLDGVQKGLADYLELKRLAFARFFFLSNDELLKILSQAKDPRAVQPHLSKCFEAINKLDFEADLTITAMNSVEGEKVAFAEHMKPKGSVEQWLGHVERIMKKSCRADVVKSLKDYQTRDRPSWVRRWSAMTVLGVGCAYWTSLTEKAIEDAALPAWYQKNVDQLSDLTDMVRDPTLTKQDRTTLGALITIDVHARDVVTLLQDQDVKALSDFDWVAQLRYYWDQKSSQNGAGYGDAGGGAGSDDDDDDDDVLVEGEGEGDAANAAETPPAAPPPPPEEADEPGDLWCKMVQASLPFGYEYLGNQPRLVVTPLTDRCYMTLMGAMHLNLGGAPAGPAGTGKTETTKDLAKGLAMQCVVFNCSDGLDYMAMAKFFKGLASSGAWACFDEFNRIDLEVLSVVAAQILTIQNAIQQGMKRFVFEGSEIGLDPRCSVFITMNPGYAGRSELPDNLKALFRPCAMMVPDYALIGEISLMSFGFKRGRPLARKMVATFRLCSEQLSAQDHYDYGMRAVKSVINACGNLKRDFPTADEELLLLRGLMDVNTPKFLAHDLPLFKGIISDLFPGLEKPQGDYADLLGALSEACAALEIQPVPVFLDKVIQMYEMTVVRHGLMLVGPTGGGKTMCYRALRRAMTSLAERGSDTYEKTKCVCLNPKSITMGQLYGETDEATQEWTDGVLACYMRDLSYEDTRDKKWLMFDGPVDAIWIENMNTVLDDNKKLCLVSGEIIQMSATMTMMFEVEDLAVASPATVSRCGMIYMEPTSLGLAPLLDSYVHSLPAFLGDAERNAMRSMFDALVPGMDGVLFFIRKQLKETVQTVDTCLVKGAFNIMSALLRRYRRDEALGQDPLSDEEAANARACAAPLWAFSIIWSICASVTGEGRPRLETFVRERAEKSGFAQHLPPASKGECSMYEFCFDQDERAWVEWMSTIPEYVVDPEKPFAEVIVPTADTVRYTFVIDALLRNDSHVMCVGETGTGKTLNVVDKLSNRMPESHAPIFVTFSARTSANQTQDFLDSKMDKRRKGVFGPPSGKKFAILIDDFNMPMREKYFAQPPIELLRQWMDHDGWYERKPPCAFRTIQDIILIGCMGPPGGGRNPVSNRMLRHFNFLSFTDMSDESLTRIFDSILGATLRKHFEPDIAQLSRAMSEATVEMYNVVRRDLLPTPAKSHYTFNLRDLARVFQGLLRADPRLVGEDKNELFGLWMHENLRVFQDRMVNAEDRSWFQSLVDRVAKEKLGVGWSEVVDGGEDPDADPNAPPKRLIYGDYLVPGSDQPVYQRVKDMTELRRVVEEALEDYNATTQAAPMRLVMFLDAIEHVSRICRVIRLPLGNALLLGVGGSGRQSLTRLAAALEYFELHQIEVAKGYGKNEWHDDLRKVLLMAGKDGKDVVFLFTDTQIVQENFLEDINNILNSGEVPNLLKNEHVEEISAALRPIMAARGMTATKTAINAFFITRVRSHLHCVLAMSPVSDDFRRRIRMFPSLVNCCTIDWFSEWPLEALESVAKTFLAESAKTFESPETVKAVGDACVFVHQSVERMSQKFFETLRRHNYVTPTSYLELLQTFIRLVAEKRAEIETQRERLQIGLDKLATTAQQVGVMEKDLVEMQPELEKTSIEVEQMIVDITADTKIADETKIEVQAQEKSAGEAAAKANEIEKKADAELARGNEKLKASLKALSKLQKKDIQDIKQFQNPPAGVKTCMEPVCIFFGKKPKMVADDSPGAKPGSKKPDYWEQSKLLVKEAQPFIDSLVKFDKENITQETIEKIQPYIDMDAYQPAAMKSTSEACVAICMWGHAMHSFYFINLEIEPLREALTGAKKDKAEAEAVLAEAQAKLAAVEAKLADLNANLDANKAKLDELKQKAATCEAQLERAGQLIGGLGGEKSRWEATVEKLTEKLHNVVGDVVVSAGVIAYNGPFTPSFRAELLDEWRARMTELRLPHTPGADIQTTLANPVHIRAWTIAGLPSDAVSIENGIIVAKARRWPLMIDPQGQANKWVKNMNKEYRDADGETAGGIDVIKLSEKDYLRTLANGIRFGRAVLLENVGETLDAALEPLLLKQTFKQGGSDVIKMGDDVIPYHPDFRFYITTKMRNPHYQPEVSVKVSLLNFFVTLDGLEDQLLGTVVMQEREDLAEAKNDLVVSNARMKKELTDVEEKILYLLSNSTGNILDDSVLIDTLAQSKVTSDEINVKVAEAEATERDIDATREKYRPVATRASVLFFCISDLASVDPMYQYSLAWFISLFVRACDEAEKNDDVDQRIETLNEFFTYSLYNNICRSLFESHKLMFSLLLAVAIMKQGGEVDAAEWRFLLAGPTDTNVTEPNPAPSWVTEKVWVEIVNLAKLPAFEGFAGAFAKNVEHYRSYFESSDAHRHALDAEFERRCTPFQRLLVTRCIRPDRFTLAAQDFVAGRLGARFIEPPPFDLRACYQESTASAPLIFVLSSGADPMADLLKFATEAKMLKRFDQVSLGQGQGPKAEAMMAQAMEEGMWVCLQNCHLAQSWMPKLDVIVETTDPERVHKDYRLWLTSMPSPAFPVAILQNGVKMTLEPPKGLKSNLIRSYARISDEYMDECKDPAAHKRLLFSICLFHAVIQDRRKFGPLGWNIKYDFTDGDLNMCQRQIKMMIDDYDVIPYKVIRVLCGEINYGGRVTDDKDRRLINNLLLNYVAEPVLGEGYSWSPSGDYVAPDASTVEEFVAHVRALPAVPRPEVFGLHENADITCDQNETYQMFETILSLQPRVGGGGGGATREETIEKAARDISERCPAPFDIDAVSHAYPTDYNQSMNTVLVQECIRYNALLVVMRDSLREGLKALKGLVVMTEQLEGVTDAIFDNQVPDLWAGKAYPSLKPLSSWVLDLLERIAFIQKWIDRGPPPVYWISGLFFPQAFLTGTLQNYARKQGCAIDTVQWNFNVRDHMTYDNTDAPPEDGCYITGFFLEGARWDHETHLLAESRPKELYTDFPLMWLEPAKDRVAPREGIYMCPAYKTLTRAGTLSTTGHSTNFVMYLEVPTDKSQSHWINSSVALFTALMF